ncbi:hypothetical protein WBP06_09570 [Novosphingobium sp. BL-8H]|uniref:hypothetical protein n=1 Tax=Novosphingobium sp. BL-8H TaxID=3127640 RepID=UPI00375637CD
MTDLSTLRQATEDDVERALAEAYVSLPITDKAAALEFFNRMLDVLAGEGVGTDE